MLTSSERVKNWRHETKQRIVEALGGKCRKCGYNQYNGSLALHHIDPSKKEFSLGHTMSCPISWKKIWAEIIKCVLLCHNCHSEHHAGLFVIDSSMVFIDPSFEHFKDKLKVPCPVCGKLKNTYNITCSLSCAGRRSRRVDWDTIDIIDMVDIQKLTKRHIGTLLGVSDSAVHKRYKKIKKVLGGRLTGKALDC